MTANNKRTDKYSDGGNALVDTVHTIKNEKIPANKNVDIREEHQKGVGDIRLNNRLAEEVEKLRQAFKELDEG